MANKTHALDGGIPLQFIVGGHRPATSDEQRPAFELQC